MPHDQEGQEVQKEIIDTQDAFAKVHIAAPSNSVIVNGSTSPNPWEEAAQAKELPLSPTAAQLNALDFAALDAVTARGLAASHDAEDEREQEHDEKKEEILHEFDPLESHEEEAARAAWAASEAHPPPPPPTLQAADAAITAAAARIAKQEHVLASSQPATPARVPSPLPSFPSLAALARTFALPLTSGSSRKPRPRSMDSAAPVPSPATISSFASQQAAPPLSAASSSSADVIGSGRNTPTGVKTKNGVEQFDFQRFLDQMKLKGAEPVAKYLRSFLSNFAKRTFTVTDQVKLINDFLNFISARMRETDVWRNASDAEFENAMEGMEKLVMNRLYDFTFTPQVARMIPPRPVTADDIERDRVLSQRIALFRWVEPQHLDIPQEHGSEGFMMFAQQELLKINHYKAPRDKLICILNCCKVIFGLIRHLRKEEGADNFIPILIYIVLKANPDHLLSNVEFINRFRNPAKLQSEAGYYLSSLMGAVSFIETMDHTSLSHMTQEEFEKNVEEAIQSLPTTGSQTPDDATTPLHEAPPSQTSIPLPSSHTGEESAQPLALPAPKETFSEDARRLWQRTNDTISKPLTAIGKIFNDVLDGAEESLATLTQELARDQPQPPPPPPPLDHPGPTPYQPRVRRPSPSPSSLDLTVPQPPSIERASPPRTNQPLALGPSQPIASTTTAPSAARLQPPRVQSLAHPPLGVSRTPTPNLDFAGMQAEIDRVHESAASAARETLRQIFPTMDGEIMELVLEANGGDLGKSIESLLEMSSGT